MNCGIMDQYIVSLGKAGHVLLIDCRSLGYELAPLPAGVSLVICNTRKKRGLLDSEYNTRRAECERGAATLGVKALRDVTPAQLEARKGELDPVTYRRCRHVVTEDARTLEAVAAMRAGDLQRLGELMNASHVSLRDDYQVSCFELDVMVEAAWQQPGVYGARMTGGGFGGCAVALVADEHAAAYAAQVAPIYRRETGIEGEIYICRADDGVHAF
jgi:galactokinase